MHNDLEHAFASHFEYRRAMESAWRWFRRNKAAEVKLGEIVAQVQAKCPGADPKEIVLLDRDGVLTRDLSRAANWPICWGTRLARQWVWLSSPRPATGQSIAAPFPYPGP
jgi:hypothetical protein